MSPVESDRQFRAIFACVLCFDELCFVGSFDDDVFVYASKCGSVDMSVVSVWVLDDCVFAGSRKMN